MDFEKKNQIPEGIKILGWLISLCAFALGFYHTAEGMKFFKPLGFEGGAFVVSALISMLLIVAYSRAVAGVKVALIFYIVCALFNFTFNLNSFYPNLNSRKLLQEEAEQVKDTLDYNISLKSNISRDAAQTDIDGLKNYTKNVVDEIKDFDGFGPKAKNALSEFNKISAKYGVPPVLETSARLKDKKVGAYYQAQLDSIRVGLEQGVVGLIKSEEAKKQFNNFLTLANSKDYGAQVMTFSDSTFQEIRDNQKTKDEDSAAYNKSTRQLGKLIEINDKTASLINALNLKYTDSVTNRLIPIRMKILNNDQKAELLFPKSKEVGKFNHTIDSMAKRIDKIDTWGVIILVFFIDFLVPFAIYFLIRKRPNDDEDQGGMGGQSEGFFSKLFGKKQPQQF